jgi:hypothetical protein
MKITSAQIKEAYIAVAQAAESAELAKKALQNLYAITEEADNARWALENANKFAPSDDQQDVLFARLTKAEMDLTEALRTGSLAHAKVHIEASHQHNEVAWGILKR